MTSIYLAFLVGRTVGLSGPPEPAVVPAQRTTGLWIVSAKMAGKPVDLLLGFHSASTLSTKVALDKGIDTRDPVDVTLGGRPLGAAQLSHEVPAIGLAHYDGVLGFDLLKTCAVGFDVADSTVTIWPGGISASEASTWTLGGKVRPGSTGRPKLWSAPLTFDNNGIPSVVVKIGTSPCSTELPLSVPTLDLFEPALVASGALLLFHVQGGDIYAATRVHLGSMGPWLVVAAPPDTTKDNSNDFVMPIEVLASERVIVDLAGQKLYGQMLDDRSRSALQLSFLFNMPMYLDGGTLRVGPMGDSGSSSFAAGGLKEGDEIVRYRGVPAAAFASLIRSGAACTPRQVVALFSSLSDKTATLILIRNGKRITLNGDKPNGGDGGG